jgi:putative Holliday junction resolvase
MLAQGVAPEAAPAGRRVLAVDFGERRIGLAISDPERRLALPLGVVERRSDRQAIGDLRDLARREEVGLLVVGEPRSPEGESGPATRRARAFGERLARACRLPCRFVEETLTTVEALSRLGRVSQRGHPGRTGSQGPPVDALAAQVILEEAISRRLVEEA